MQTFLAGQTVSINVPMVDASGAPVVATAISYRLLDEAGAELIPATALTPWLSSFDVATIPVASPYNTLAAGATRGLRQIILTATTDAGTVVLSAEYALVSLTPLTVPTDSYVSYGQALLVALTIPDIPGWNGASKDERIAALMQAKRHIERLRYRFEASDSMSRIDPMITGSMVDLTPAEYAALPVEFRAALEVASVMEADDLMREDARHMREQGILSKTVGESSMMVQSGVPKRGIICARAKGVLVRFLDVGRITIGRA